MIPNGLHILPSIYAAIYIFIYILKVFNYLNKIDMAVKGDYMKNYLSSALGFQHK